jgi:predicted transcriptional regulator of viral defense system
VPSWDALFEVAATQEGHFTTRQAARAGYSPQLLNKHVHAGRLARVRRGVYRLVHFPAGDHEDLVAIWLWSERAGAFSHHTALVLHGLSDLLPARVHFTLPNAWRTRRLRVPDDVVVHHSDIAPGDLAWFGPVPATSARVTLIQCARDGLSPDLLRQATREALARGLVTASELGEVDAALSEFGGVPA